MAIKPKLDLKADQIKLGRGINYQMSVLEWFVGVRSYTNRL